MCKAFLPSHSSFHGKHNMLLFRVQQYSNTGLVTFYCSVTKLALGPGDIGRCYAWQCTEAC